MVTPSLAKGSDGATGTATAIFVAFVMLTVVALVSENCEFILFCGGEWGAVVFCGEGGGGRAETVILDCMRRTKSSIDSSMDGRKCDDWNGVDEEIYR